MKKCLIAVAACCLVLSWTAAYAGVIFSDDFSVPPNTVGQSDPNWTAKSQPGWLVPNWQVTADQKYTCVNSDYSGVNWAWTAAESAPNTDLILGDYNMSADITINAQANGGMAGFMIRGQPIPDYGNGASFDFISVQGPAYGGRIIFSHFEFFEAAPWASIYDTATWNPLPQSGDANAYVHLTLSCVGTTFTANATSYDGAGNLVANSGPLVLDESTTPFYINPADISAGQFVPTTGFAGLVQFSQVVKFDNVLITTVPEPSSLMALATGLGFALVGLRRRVIK